MPSSLHMDGFPEPRRERVYVLVAPQDYLALEGAGALPDDAILRRTMFLSLRPPHRVMDDEFARLRRAGAVFEVNMRSVAILNRAGVPARHLRPGYSEFRDRFDLEAERELDVMFLGSHTRRRSLCLNRCASVLARHNCLLQFADNSHPNPTGSSSYLAEGKWDLLSRAKIVLNLHQGEDTGLEWIRILEAIHAGAVVVSEHSSGLAPLVAGEHLLVGSPDSLPFVLDAALRDEARLQRLRVQAYERIRNWIPFAMSVSVFRASAVELVGRPVPPNASRGQTSTSGEAVSPRWEPDQPTGGPQIKALRRVLSDAERDVAELRREVGRLKRVSLTGAPSHRHAEIVGESPTWSLARPHAVTVVTTASNHQAHLRGTLDSVVRSRFRDFELVIVGDDWTGNSCDIALDWMHTHPGVPTRVIAPGIARSSGGARNAALDLARAPYCLILDPGTEVYPRCLEVLLVTLRAMPDAMFAYPIGEVVGLSDAFVATGGDYLTGFFGWEPGRLRISDYIGPLAMIRTDRLRELGGFAYDHRLDGWEQYDLWCRVAEHGWRGQLVPQVLGRRRASTISMLTTNDPSAATAVTALIERSPRLLAGILPPV